MFQAIRPDGSTSEGLNVSLEAEELKKLYRVMVTARIFDRKAMTLQRQGKIAFYVPCEGQEACHVGSAYALAPEDWVFPQYREPAVCMMRGMSLRAMFSQLLGNGEDLCKGHNMPCMWADRRLRLFSASAPVGTQIPIAVGAALAARLRGERTVALVYFGDGATSTYGFHSGMNFAGVFRAPALFLCQNNQYAISVPLRRQTASETLAIKAKAYGFEGVRVDGNDVLAVYSACRDAAERARRGEGPTLVEAVTYRLGPHSTSDDPRRYRDSAEVEGWRKKDPLARLRLYLERRGLWGEAEEARLLEEAKREVDRAAKEALDVPPPPPESLFDDVYASEPWSLREQREEFLNAFKAGGR